MFMDQGAVFLMLIHIHVDEPRDHVFEFAAV